jgi:hypothetical protein
MSSIAARIGVANHALYAGSKSAVEGFARSFAADGGPRRITANAIAPGGIKTDMFAQNAWHYSPGATKDTPLEVIEAGIAKLIPLGRCAVPDDIAKVVMFLCHPDSEWINGERFCPTPKMSLADVDFSLRSNHHPHRWQRHCLNDLVTEQMSFSNHPSFSTDIFFVASKKRALMSSQKFFLG